MEALKRGVVCFELMEQYDLNAKENLYLSAIDNVCKELGTAWANIPTGEYAQALRVSNKTISRMTEKLVNLRLMEVSYVPGETISRRVTGIYREFYQDYTP